MTDRYSRQEGRLKKGEREWEMDLYLQGYTPNVPWNTLTLYILEQPSPTAALLAKVQVLLGSPAIVFDL